MKCEFSEKVSMLIDGELSEADSKEVKTHINECEDCRNLEKDFLFFRQQIKGSLNDEIENEQFVYKEKKSFFDMKISIPAPVFSLLILLLVGGIVWFFLLSANQDVNAEKNQDKITFPIISSKDETSLARYDKGGKAEIYVIPQQNVGK